MDRNSPHGWQAFLLAYSRWSDETFEGNDGSGARAHLMRELVEVAEAHTDEERLVEYADCVMLIFDAARRDGFDADAVLRAAWAKLAINRDRVWGERQPDGSVEHVRGPKAGKI